jgi:hypothetical protein
MYSLGTVCSHYLAVMCINVIYKCLSWSSDQKQDMGKPSLKQPSQAINRKLLGVGGYPTWWVKLSLL